MSDLIFFFSRIEPRFLRLNESLIMFFGGLDPDETCPDLQPLVYQPYTEYDACATIPFSLFCNQQFGKKTAENRTKKRCFRREKKVMAPPILNVKKKNLYYT